MPKGKGLYKEVKTKRQGTLGAIIKIPKPGSFKGTLRAGHQRVEQTISLMDENIAKFLASSSSILVIVFHGSRC